MNVSLPDFREEYLAQTLTVTIWLRRGLALVIGVQVALILVAHAWALVINAVVTIVFFAIASLIIYFCRRNNLRAASLAILLAPLIGSILMLAISSNALAVVAVYPAMACAGIASLTTRSSLRRISIAAVAIFAVLSAWKLLLPLQFDANWFDCLQLYFGLNLTVAMSVMLIWFANSRFAVILAGFSMANQELTAIKATLESQVEARTSEAVRSVEMLRATLEATADGIVLTDHNSTPIIWNCKFVAMWQLPEQLLFNRDPSVRLRHMSAQLKDPVAFFARWNEIVAQPESVSLDTMTLRDGRVFERYSQPQLLDGHGLSRVWSVRDVTKRVNAERRAHVFAALGQELSATVTVEDAARTIINVADELLGWDACYLDFYDPEDESLETIICIDTINGERIEQPLPPASTLRFEEHRILRGGAQLMLREPTDPDLGELVSFGDLERPSASLMFVPIRRGTSTIGVFSIQSYTHHAYTQADLATFQNLANHCAGALERNRSEAALRQAEEQRQQLERKMLETQKLESLGVLAGGIAHDFNNLLAVILGNINVAQIEVGSNHPAAHSIQQAETATRRAADLTHQMLAYTGKGQFVTQRIDINRMIGELSQLLTASMPKHVQFSYDLAVDLPELEGDATQLRQVCMNLIINAAEAIGDRTGHVTVHTLLAEVDATLALSAVHGTELQAGSYIAIEVSDNGCGMDAVTIAKIFEPFFSTKFTGRGLGLAAVLGIVRSHHGAVRVTSEPGVGTTFRVLLPPAQRIAEAATSDNRAEAQHHWQGQGTILVVDDEPAVRDLIARMIEKFGFTPLLASDGIEALERFYEHAPNLAAVLLDLTMPQMHGHDVLQHMHDFNPAVPVILMSGYNEQETGAFSDAAHTGRFLHKPFRLADVRTVLQQVTAGSI